MPKQRRRPIRLFLDRELALGTLALESAEAHYLSNVLRLKRGDHVRAFNGRGAEFSATVEGLTKRSARLALVTAEDALPESALQLSLIQSVAKGDAMDTIVQKATELGVTHIYPVTTDHTVVRLDSERAGRRVEHWRKIARGACEQSGRHRPPLIHEPANLDTCSRDIGEQALKLVLDPQAQGGNEPTVSGERHICLFVGPEGGLSEQDLRLAASLGFEGWRIGQRTLRADTAAIVACALAQRMWGDLN